MIFENISFLITAIIYFGIVLGLAVIFHEWGHFIVAKMCGAKVDKFGVGFGKTLISKQWGETEYSLNALPLGGFVKIRGMEPDDDMTGAEFEFLELSPWRRILIVLAGPFMNFVLALLIYIFLFTTFGQAYTATTSIGYIPNGSLAWEMGLHEDDTIVAINGHTVESWNDVSRIFASAFSPIARSEYFPSQEFTVNIERDGQSITKTGTIPNPLWDEPATESVSNVPVPPADYQGIYVTEVLQDKPAAQAGMKPGMIIQEANGEVFHSRAEWSDFIAAHYEADQDGNFTAVPITFKVLNLEGEVEDITVTPELIIPDEDARPFQAKASIGILYTGEISVLEYFIPQLSVLSVAPKLPPVIGVVQDGSPADKAGLTVGSRIVEINGEEVDDWIDVLLAIHGSVEDPRAPKGQATAKTLETTWLTPDNQMVSTTIQPEITYKPILTPHSVKTGKEYAIAQIGIDQKADRKYLGIVGATVAGWHKLVDMTTMMVDFLYQLFTGQVSPKLLGGPVAIAQLSVESGSWGIERLFLFIALLSANLGLINLFPLPPLDGGHIVFYTYEIARRKPITMKQMENFGKVGFMIIIPLMIFLLINDFLRLNLFGWISNLFG